MVNLTVSDKGLKKMFTDFVSSTKVMFNFKVHNNKIDVQMLGDYTVCKTVTCDLVTGTDDDISFWVNSSIHVFTDKEPIKVSINDAMITFTQGDTSSSYLREYEARRDFPSADNFEMKPAFAKRLQYLVHSAVSCMSIAKEVNMMYPDPIFSDGKFIMDFTRSAFVESIDYPECCISLDIMRAFAYRLDEKSTYCYLEDKAVIYFKSDEYVFWIPTANYNIKSSSVKSILEIANNLKDVVQISIKEDYDRLEVLTKAFPKQIIHLSLGDNKLSAVTSVLNSHVHIGSRIDKPLLSMDITSAQLSAILKLFKDVDVINIKRGVNCLCLNLEEKNLLISGMIY